MDSGAPRFRHRVFGLRFRGVCFFVGVVLSYVYSAPTGASVVMVNIFAFLLFAAIAAVKNRRRPA